MSNETEGAIEVAASESGRGATKFDELLAASRAAAARWGNYEMRSYAIAHAMRAGIANFLGLRLEAVAFRPVLKPGKDGVGYAAAGAMEISNEDGYWHFGLVIPIGFQQILLRFMMKLTPQGPFVVNPYWENGGAPTFEVVSDKDDFSAIAQWVFDRIKDYFDFGFDRFIAGDGGSNKIGFLSRLK